jgi:pyruvate/2-oxoglutarate dehydrogenase complex dihydrolipoamide dehydrogenase (E3) component
MEELPLAMPPDEYNDELIRNVHPFDWKNPEPAAMYNLVVIGAGTAGLVTAAGAAGLGAKVALVEKRLMGGDCLNLGCVPSKTIISSSRVSEEVRQAAGHGVRVICGAEADFPAVMERMRRLRARISKNDSVRRFTGLGVEVFLGAGRFTGPGEVVVDGKTLRFRKAVIATGARAFHPPVPGLDETGYLTNESVFNLASRPRRLAVLGGGAIGCELAQAFGRLGSEVTIFQNKPRLMEKEDPDASEIIQHVLRREGVRMVFGDWTLKRVEQKGGEKLLHMERDGEKDVIAADELLVATGRSPNVQGLGLEAAGVEYDMRGGVVVDETLRTSNPDIYAAGDICLKYQFTHTADASARVVIQNALFMGRKKLSAHAIPWCTFTDPEVAHVGMYEESAQAQGIAVDTFMRRSGDIDRAVLEGEEEDGFVKIHVKRGTDRILGATIVSAHAGEMISEITLAMEAGLGLKALSETIHPYPTRSEGIKKVADDYNRTRLTPAIRRILARWLEFKRKT